MRPISSLPNGGGFNSLNHNKYSLQEYNCCYLLHQYKETEVIGSYPENMKCSQEKIQVHTIWNKDHESIGKLHIR